MKYVFFAIWGKCCRMQISMSSEFWAAFGNKSSSLWLFPEKDQCPVSFNFIWRCQENFVKEMDIYQWAEWMGVDRFQVMNLLENKVFNFPKLDLLLPHPPPPPTTTNICRSNFRASSQALLVWSLMFLAIEDLKSLKSWTADILLWQRILCWKYFLNEVKVFNYVLFDIGAGQRKDVDGWE